MRLQAWKYLTQSWDRADQERARLEKATMIFFEDIQRDDWQSCAKLIERGCSPNMALGHRTAIMVAAENGAVNALKLLVSTGASLGAQDELGRDALFWAVETRCDEAVDYLLLSGSRIKRLFTDNSTPLIEAAKSSYVHGVQALVKHHKHCVNLFDRMGRTALWHVLSKDELTDADNQIARILMDAGANPDMADLDGVSPRESTMSQAGKSLVERHDITSTMENDADMDLDFGLDNEDDYQAPAPKAPNRRPRL